MKKVWEIYGKSPGSAVSLTLPGLKQPRIRIEKAKELMLEGKMSMGEIADKLGFSSQGYFRESFKAVYGVTPSSYIKSLKGITLPE